MARSKHVKRFREIGYKNKKQNREKDKDKDFDTIRFNSQDANESEWLKRASARVLEKNQW